MPASLLQTLRALARNNAWANLRLHRACSALTQAEFAAERTGFFPSVQATLNHILIVDRFYVDALEGGRLGYAAFDNRIPCPTMAELMPAQAEVDRRLVAWCDAMGPDGPDGIVEVHRPRGIQRERADRLLLHLCQHDIHHRGQAHAMLSATSVPPPQLDEFFSEGEAPLRAEEFSALGYSEEAIWRT